MNERGDERPLKDEEIGEWEIIEPEAVASRSAVLTVRFTPDELRTLRTLAKASGEPMAEVVRKAVQSYVSGRSSVVAMGWGTTGGGNANILARSGLVTLGQGRDVEEDEKAPRSA